MTSKRKFYINRYEVTVLSEDNPTGAMSLSELHEACANGTCSGKVIQEYSQELPPRAMAEELQAQDSKPALFNLDDLGNDLNDEHDDGLKTIEQRDPL